MSPTLSNARITRGHSAVKPARCSSPASQSSRKLSFNACGRVGLKGLMQLLGGEGQGSACPVTVMPSHSHAQSQSVSMGRASQKQPGIRILFRSKLSSSCWIFPGEASSSGRACTARILRL